VDANTGAARTGTMTIAGQTFTVNQAAAEVPPVTVSGIVRDLNGGVIASGVTVSLAGDPTKTASASTTDGSFSLPGLPANTTLSLKFAATGYLDLYTLDFSVTGDTNISVDAFGGSGPINMLTESELIAVGAMPASGKALVLGRVSDMTYRYSSNVGGAAVTATSTVQHPAEQYPVVYRSPFGVLTSASGTWGNGMFYVLNVDAGDTLTLTAARSGWNFPARTFRTRADAVTLGSLRGAAPGYDASLGGFVKTTAGAGVSGATVALKGDPGKFVTTNPDGYGSFVFGALPRDANFKVKVTAGGFVDTYADAKLPGSVTGVTYLMFTPGDLAMLGVTSNNGLLGGTIFDQTMMPLAGATVALTSMTETYAATYPGGSGSTAASGQFLVPNVRPGDVVQVEVTRAGYTFNAIYMNGFASSVTEAMIMGTAISCTYTLDPASASPAAAGGSAAVSVAAGTGCSWTAVSNNTDWLHVTSGVSGSGSGEVGYTVDANTGAARTGTMTIAGQTFTVTQAAAVVPHPEATTIESRFAAAINLIKAGNFTGFAGYISENFLDYGENKALFLAEVQEEPGALDYTIQSITGTGDYAVMNLTWSDGELDTLYFRKEGGGWMLYGNQHLFDAWANSSHEMYPPNSWPYWVNLSVEDPDLPGLTITSVTVTGTDLLAGGIPLVHDATRGQWDSWMGDAQAYLRWATAPTVPRAYTFTIAYDGSYGEKTSPEVYTYQVMSFVEVAPSLGSLSPASGSTATRPLVFSWDSVGAGYTYRVEVTDPSYNRIWDSDESTTATSPAYAGPTLPAGSYYYHLDTRDAYENMSMIHVPFMMPPLKGDLNGDNKVDLADAVLALRILAGFSPTSGLRADYAASGTDVNGDDPVPKVGLAELEFILQSAAGLRLQ
jgi:hypothetical protein